jgi:glycosyltransferase involved in cell wall biosynthesis
VDGSRRVQLSIVVPVYNEEDNLASLSEKLSETLASLEREYEIIFVNDGSTDASRERLDELALRDPRVKVIHLRRNAGQTAALMAGFDHASAEIIVATDADMQNDPADIPKLLAKLDEGYDVCSGWRKDRRDHLLTRVLPSRAANRLVSLISGVRLKDHGCTLKAYRREFVDEIRLYGEMHRFIPVYAAWAGAKIAEVPISHSARQTGRSKYGSSRIVKVLLDLIVLKFLLSYADRPIYVFGGFGLLSLCGSFAFFALMVYYKFWGGKSFVETPLPLLVVLLFLMGFVSLLMGLIAEVLMRTYHESQGKPAYLVESTRNFEETS